MLDRQQGTFTCDHVPHSDDPEEQARLIEERTIVVSPVWPIQGDVCPFCGKHVGMRHFEGKCMAPRKLRRKHEAKRDRPDRMRERGFRCDEHVASYSNVLVPTKQEKNAAKRKRRARR